MPAPTVFPFEPNGGDTIIEWYGYLTDIIGPAYEGQEQRVQLRRHPTGAIETSFFSETTYEFQRMLGLLFRKHGQVWAAPLWPYATRLTADAAAGDTIVQAVTAGIPFTDPLGLGPYALLWKNSKTFELLALNAIYPSSLELVTPLAAAWPSAGTFLIPIRTAFLDSTVPLRWETPQLVTGRHHFTFESHGTDTIVPTLTDDLAVIGDTAEPVG